MDTSPVAIQQPLPRPNPVVLVATLGYLGVIGWLTLTPGSANSVAPGLIDRAIRLLSALPIELTWSQWEFVLNIALFVPLGFLLVLLFGRKFFWLALVTAVMASVAIEWMQHFVPVRVPDTRDLIANGLGGLIGMLIGLAVPRRRSRA